MVLLHQAVILTGLCRPAVAKWLWSSTPASTTDVEQQAYPLGNGRLGLMPAGEPGAESINLNLDSLWTGGPFENATYSGGNPSSDRSHFLPGIREEIFRNGTGNVDTILGEIYSYGSYTPLANLTVSIDGLDYDQDSYFRGLDLETGVHSTRFSNGGQQFNTSVFCSYPDDVCVYNIVSNSALPEIKFGLTNNFLNSTLMSTTCVSGQLQVSGQLAQPGMKFVGLASVSQPSKAQCTGGSIVLPKGKESSISIIVGAGSDYDQTKGNKASGYSFKGSDPTSAVKETISSAGSHSYQDILARHIKDHQSLFNTFSLDLPDPLNSSQAETSEIILNYNLTVGDPWLESLFFDYGRYLLIGSSRDNSLPANLQGRWAVDQYPAWSADYHVDINLQMNYWAAPQVGLGSLQDCLWDHMEQTWVPYGEETARLLYGVSDGSWVVHDEINTFGYTAMKNDATWANFPLAGTWMALHIPNWFDYSNDVEWYQKQGYPLLKGTAKFWLSQLQKDLYFNDGTLVVNPCNSPEHGPTTFGCSMYQQQLYELFDRILATWSESGDEDMDFHQDVVKTLASLDRGIHIGSWGQLQEWKMDIDVENDTHRHLSGLSGWYPGYSVAIEQNNKTVADAVETMLWSRGDGDGSDANAGWEKVWRSACWARLNNTDQATYELRFTIQENMAENGLSMYSARDLPFQIDANFGLVAAVLEMLILDLPQIHQDKSVQIVVLGPAIPASWGGGQVHGMRLRGGGQAAFSWDSKGVVQSVTLSGRKKEIKLVNSEGVEIGH